MENETFTPRVETFYRALQARVEEWLATDEARRFHCAELYRFLPGLYAFLIHLALDHRLPERERTGIRSALKYIVAPYDMIPEAVVGTSGFRDDLVLAALMVDRLSTTVDASIFNDHWRDAGNPREIAQKILDNSMRMVDPDICEHLKEWLPH